MGKKIMKVSEDLKRGDLAEYMNGGLRKVKIKTTKRPKPVEAGECYCDVYCPSCGEVNYISEYEIEGAVIDKVTVSCKTCSQEMRLDA